MLAAAVAVVIILSWMHANALRSALMLPRADDEAFDLTVL